MLYHLIWLILYIYHGNTTVFFWHLGALHNCICIRQSLRNMVEISKCNDINTITDSMVILKYFCKAISLFSHFKSVRWGRRWSPGETEAIFCIPPTGTWYHYLLWEQENTDQFKILKFITVKTVPQPCQCQYFKGILSTDMDKTQCYLFLRFQYIG